MYQNTSWGEAAAGEVAWKTPDHTRPWDHSSVDNFLQNPGWLVGWFDAFNSNQDNLQAVKHHDNKQLMGSDDDFFWSQCDVRLFQTFFRLENSIDSLIKIFFAIYSP